MLGAKRAAAIDIDHVRVGTSKRLVLVRTSSEQEAQHEECRSDEYQPRLDDGIGSQRAARGLGEGGRFVHVKPIPLTYLLIQLLLGAGVELTSSYAPAARHLQRIKTGARGRKATSGLLVFAAMRNMAAD